MNAKESLLDILDKYGESIFFEDLALSYKNFKQLVLIEMEKMKASSHEEIIILNSPSSYEPVIVSQWCAHLLAHLELKHIVALKSEADPYEYQINYFASLTGPGLILKTSGSTSAPKIVYHPLANAFLAAKRFYAFYAERTLCNWQLNLPLHHIGGLSLLFRALYFGQKIVCHSERKEIHPKAQAISLVPTQLTYLLDHSCERLKELKLILIGGAHTPIGLKKRAKNLAISYSYGLTESFAAIGATQISGKFDKAFFFPEILAKVEEQTLLISGPGLLQCLIKEQLIFNFEDKYYPTQDKARIHEDKSFEILGRLDQVINSGGEKIDLTEVEALLSMMSEIESFRAIGAPSKKWGEALIVFVYPFNQSIKVKIEDLLTKKLGPYYRPKLIKDLSKVTHQGIKPSSLDFLATIMESEL